MPNCQHSITSCCVQSKKRGLSIEEKKQVVLQIFHETKDVFVLKARSAAAKSSFKCYLPKLSSTPRLTSAHHLCRTWKSSRRRGASFHSQ